MQPWMPDWNKMMKEAPEIPVAPGKGYVYLIADSHLGRGPAFRPTAYFIYLSFFFCDGRVSSL